MEIAKIARSAGGDAVNADTDEWQYGQRWLGEPADGDDNESIEPEFELRLRDELGASRMDSMTDQLIAEHLTNVALTPSTVPVAS